MDHKTFAELGLSPKVQAALDEAGYTIPTPIQASAIPIAVTGRDVLGIAQTGTGKTAAFVLPMITRLETGRARARMPRSLILAPTRELAAQVAQSFEKYGVHNKLTLALLIGGVSFDEQNKKLDRGVDVLIATPGRLLDHFQRGRVMLMGVEILVIDEADRMLDMGFIPDIEKICKLLPPQRQTLFFSATMPAEITRLVDQFLKSPARVEAAPPATTAKTITQRFIYCAGEDWQKRETLRRLMSEQSVRNAIIFCNRKVEVAILHKSLLKHGFNAGALHGDMDQRNRMETLDKFRSGAITFLAASDVAARGLDIPDVSHIFNYDLPRESDDYVHRIGRTGRAGKEGYSASLVTSDDLRVLKDIEKMVGEPVTWLGEGPTEEDYTDASSRRRGRGGRGASGGRDSRPMRGGPRPSRSGTFEKRSTERRVAPDGGGSPEAAHAQPRPADARPTDARPAEDRPAEDRLADARVADARPAEETAGDHRRPRAPLMERIEASPRGGEGRRHTRPMRRDGQDQPRATSQPRSREAQPREAEPRETQPREPQPREGQQREAPALQAQEPAQPAARAPRRPDPHGAAQPTGREATQTRARDASQDQPHHSAAASDERRDRGDRPRFLDRKGGQPAPDGQPARQRSNSAGRENQRGTPSREERGASPRDEKAAPRRDSGSQGQGGFADNVPAFLRKPPRPAKVVSE